ncbi:MAG: pilus assembly protein [Burkholderiaceae bacterium]|nr:pilus assembly protein [Burkholderiaceae bacterium]
MKRFVTRARSERRAASSKHRGNAAVEFAIAASLFFLLLFSVLDFSYLFWVNLTMQHAVREGSRYAITGQSGLDPEPDPLKRDRCIAAKAKIQQTAMGLYEKLSPTIVFKTVNSATGVATALGGSSCYGAGQIIVIQLQAETVPMSPLIRAFFPNGKYVFSVSSTMRNEAFGT